MSRTPALRWLARARLTSVLAGLGLLASVLLANPTAGAAPTDTPTVVDNAIVGTWGDDTTHQVWNGSQYTSIEASFVGDRVISPGDKVWRVLNVTNNGPSAAMMTVSFILSARVPPGAQNPGLAKDVSLLWDVEGVAGQGVFDKLLAGGGQPAVAQVTVAQGATVPVKIGFSVAPTLATDKSGAGASTVLSFDVLVQLQGDPGGDLPTPTPTVPPTVPPTTPPVTPPKSSTGGSPAPGWVTPAVALFAAGAVLAAVVRRRPATAAREA